MSASHAPQSITCSPIEGSADSLVTLPGGPLRIRFYGRRPTRGAAPLVLHLHGGQFVSGGLDSGACVARLLEESGAVVASLDYPLAPAHPFPQAIEAVHAVAGWLHQRRAKLAGAGADLWIAGEEAGGNLAAAVSLMARDQQGPQIAGQVLISPMLDACLATASARDAHAGPVGCRWADGWHQYLPRASDADHPYAAPGSSRRLAGLPPTMLITAQDDMLRDETQSFGERLREAGVPVHSAVLEGITGWPCSLMQGQEQGQGEETPPMDDETARQVAAWRATLSEQLRQFFAEHRAASA